MAQHIYTDLPLEADVSRIMRLATRNRADSFLLEFGRRLGIWWQQVRFREDEASRY
jgi:hypothetical protein